MISTWDEIVKNRRQYDCWDLDKELPLATVKEIIQETHTFSAKKQNRPEIEMLVVGWEDAKLRDDIWWYTTLDEAHRDVLTINPQVLAHYLVIFVRPKEWKDPICYISVGIQADFIAHAAAARGLQTGFCQCTDDKNLHPDQIQNIKDKLGLEDIDDITLILGLGHGIVENSMINPYSGESVKCWARIDEKVDPVPPMDQYIKFL